jgi:hypothetical protein
METRVTEVADGVHQLSTFVGAPVGFDQYLIAADEPLLFHTGMRQMFPLVSAGVSKVLLAETLRWVSFGHVEAAECGSMNDPARAPRVGSRCPLRRDDQDTVLRRSFHALRRVRGIDDGRHRRACSSGRG